MAIEYLKKGLSEKQRIEDNDKVKKIVEETLRKIELEGDKHIRELSKKFDNYSNVENIKLFIQKKISV